MFVTILALILLGAAASTTTLWYRTRRGLRDVNAERERLRTAMTALEDRFRPVVDVDAELRRLATERDGFLRRIEEEAAQYSDSVRANEAAQRQRRATAEQELASFEHAANVKRAQLEAEITDRRTKWEAQFAGAMATLTELHKEVEGLNEEAEIQSFGLYKARYQFASSEEFARRLDRIRDQQKQMVKQKTAATCATVWQVSGSSAEGRRMVERQLKLMLRAFNGECDGTIANVSWKNVVTLQERIRKSFDAINKLGETVQCHIERSYLALKEEELQLAYEHAEKQHEEKEEQRALREQMRDEERGRRELERARDEAERDEDKYATALERARADVESTNEKERATLDAKIAKLEGMLAAAEERRQRAVSQAELTKSGHVYVLSNEGSLGANVFKIGMTRRLDPLDRVYELGGAPVPFHFDVHALIRSDDAPALEAKIHAALEPHRVNLVNRRKEFFRVPIEKVVDLVTKHHGRIEFTQLAEASEYRKTLAIRAEREAMVAGRAVHAVAVKKVDELRARFEDFKKATA
jgi:hypothetical protein